MAAKGKSLGNNEEGGKEIEKGQKFSAEDRKYFLPDIDPDQTLIQSKKKRVVKHENRLFINHSL